MARPPAPGTRDRILDSATRLFLARGASTVGTQQIVDDCGCGKNLLYREFPSKDDLVVAFLERCQAEWDELVDAAVGPVAGDPVAEIAAVVRAAADRVADPAYRICPFRGTGAQLPRDHPAQAVVARHVGGTRDRLLDAATRAGARDPAALADRLILVIDGMYIDAAILGPDGPAAATVDLAAELVRAAMN